MKVSDQVFESIKPLFDSTDIRLVEVEYVKRNDGMHLIVYIDKENGVTIDDCVTVNQMIDNVLEELNPTNDAPYNLDVSSYGLDRPLKYDWQLDKYLGKKVNVTLYKKVDNIKTFIADFISYNDNMFVFELDNNKISFERVVVAHILPHIEF